MLPASSKECGVQSESENCPILGQGIALMTKMMCVQIPPSFSHWMTKQAIALIIKIKEKRETKGAHQKAN
jgi:hypothetical protein